MKFVIISLLLITQIFSAPAQVWVKTGTGLRDVSYQWKLQGMKYGCLFMACCAMGGLANDQQMLQARKWAISQGLIREDTYCNYSSQYIAQKISQYFGTTFHSNYNTKKGCGHFWLVDQNGREVFNASGLGKSGC